MGNPEQKSLIKVWIYSATRSVAHLTIDPWTTDRWPVRVCGRFWLEKGRDFFHSDVIENIIAAKPNYVEIFLNGLKRIIEAEKNKDFTEQV